MVDSRLFHEIWTAVKMQPLLGTVDKDGFVWTVPRQVFVRLYVATGDADVAARDSHLPEDDDPEELLEHPSMQAKIGELHDAVLRRIHETSDTVMSRYSNIADSNIYDHISMGDKHPVTGRIVNGNVSMKDPEKMSRHMQQRVKKIDITTTAHGDTNFKIEMHDPMKANDALARILGLDGEKDPEDAKMIAQQIHDFFNDELDDLDNQYEYPDQAEASPTDDGGDK